MGLRDPENLRTLINSKGGLARLNRYRVIFPEITFRGDIIHLDTLCRSVTLPTRSITSRPRRVNMKPYEVPTGYTVVPIDVQFTETKDFTVNRYIDAWQEQCVDPGNYSIAYRDQVVRDFFLLVNDDTGSYLCHVKNAFPKIKTQIDFSDTAQDTAVEVRVQFECEDIDMISGLPTGDITNIGIDVISRLVRARAGELAQKASKRLNGILGSVPGIARKLSVGIFG